MPFLSYFAAVADASGTGHPGRDCYASIVRWNVPTAEVRVADQVVATLPGVFPDGQILTYTGDPGEVAFLELLKTSEALELAANDVLEPIADCSIDICSAEATERATAAAGFLAALAAASQTFAALAPEAGGLGHRALHGRLPAVRRALGARRHPAERCPGHPVPAPGSAAGHRFPRIPAPHEAQLSGAAGRGAGGARPAGEPSDAAGHAAGSDGSASGRSGTATRDQLRALVPSIRTWSPGTRCCRRTRESAACT